MKANLGLPGHQFPAYWYRVNRLTPLYTHIMWENLLGNKDFKLNTCSQDADYYCMYIATDLI